MKCKIFWGCAKEALDAFNKWAKGKQLNREVIIHEHIYLGRDPEVGIEMIIFVYHPDGKEWDKTEQPPAKEDEIIVEAQLGDP